MKAIAACARRREVLQQSLSSRDLLFIVAAPEVFRNADCHYPYRQNSDFHYLTNFPESDSALIIAPGSAYGDAILFCRDKDPQLEQWTGERIGVAAASRDYKVSCCFSIDDFIKYLVELLADRDQVFVPTQDDSLELLYFDQAMGHFAAEQKKKITLTNLTPKLAEMRLIKDSYEVDCMQKAADISVISHMRAWSEIDTANNEADLSAVMHAEMEKNHACTAYPSIVAAAKNALILHYQKNNQQLFPGDLVLIDAGAEYNCYASDITRTIPVSGEFTAAQRDIYQCVLDAQLSVIKHIKPGVLMGDLQSLTIKILCSGLLSLGVLQGSLQECINKKSYSRFYMHGVSHWLGLDTHDCSGLEGEPNISRVLRPGMCLTVEPGLYIPAAEDIPIIYHNIGIRIEDDILVTEDGVHIFSSALPKSIADIESFFSKK